MILRLLSLFHRRRVYDWRAPYDTGAAPVFYGNINWDMLRQRAASERRRG